MATLNGVISLKINTHNISFIYLRLKQLRRNYVRVLLKEMLVAAVDFDKTHTELSSLLEGLGITHPIPATLEEETLADLFSEQVILCGVIPILAKKSMDFLVKKGIPKELAWTECWSEVKLIADAMLKLARLVSGNSSALIALVGAKKFENFIDWEVLFEKTYKDLESGKFIEEIEEALLTN